MFVVSYTAFTETTSSAFKEKKIPKRLITLGDRSWVWNNGKYFYGAGWISYVTNITLLGLAMVNWSISLLNPGGDNSYCGIRSCIGPYR